MINIGQSNSKLFIQYGLTESFGIESAATILSLIIVCSRITRVLGNFCFNKVYFKIKDNIFLLLSIMEVIAFACICIGNLIVFSNVIKFVVMTIGFCIILGIRDQFKIYIQDVILKNSRQVEQQKIFSYMEFFRSVIATVFSFCVSIALTKVNLVYVIYGLLVLAIVTFVFNYHLYDTINNKNIDKKSNVL